MGKCKVCGIILQGKKEICGFHQWENADDEERKPKQIRKSNNKININRCDIGNKQSSYPITF